MTTVNVISRPLANDHAVKHPVYLRGQYGEWPHMIHVTLFLMLLINHPRLLHHA